MAKEGKSTVVPRLRFPEFRDEDGWATKKLGNALRFQPGYPFSSVHFNESRNGLRLVRNRDLRSDDKIVFFSGSFDENYVVNNGDVLVGMDGDFTPTLWRKGKALLNQRVGRVLPRQGSDQRFLLYFLDAHLKDIEDSTARTTVKHLSHSDVEEIDEPVPGVSEQQKIADCLTSLDEVIAAQERKVETLKAYKRGLMQQLFPREGETVPRLRFSEFRDGPEWAERQLSTAIQLVSGVHLSSDQYSSDGEVPYFTGPSDFTNNVEAVPKWTAASANTAKANDTLITVKGSGVGEIWHLTISSVAMGRQLMAVRAAEQSSRFVYYFLLTKRVRFEDLAAGNLIPGLSRGDILGMPAKFPCDEEQHRIASCLSALDSLTAEESKKLDALNAHKQGLMQQLFPSPQKLSA